MTKTKIENKTRDGSCPTYVFRPAGTGPWPAVLVFMDGIGIRPAMLELGEHTIETYPAKHGWVFRDLPIYDAAATERHRQALFALLDTTIKT